MKNDTFTVIPQNMVEYQMSVREADLENDLFRIAFHDACKEDKPDGTAEQLFALDFFKYGWEAAVGCLSDDKAVVAPLPAEQAVELPAMSAQLEVITRAARRLGALGYTGPCGDALDAVKQIAAALAARQAPDVARDTARLEFMMMRSAWIAWSKDGESCRLFHCKDDESVPMLGWGARHWSHDPREAIDAVIAQEKA